MPTTSKIRARAIAAGYKSGLEERIASELEAQGVPVLYEELTVRYEKPARASRYRPDFPLPNGIIIESKGRFVTADRQKHILIQRQFPELDIRFVFSRSAARISKASATTYAKWCDTHGFLWADASIPPEWLAEPPCKTRIAAIKAACGDLPPTIKDPT